MAHLWGIDLGGTKIEGVILDPTNPEHPLARLRLPTDSDRGYDHILAQIAQVCHLLGKETGLPLPANIGMGTPGVIDPTTHLLEGSNTQCLNGRALQLDLQRVHGIHFVTANDANCFALAEATLGAGRGHATVFGVILGTGVGGGIIAHGKILSGCHGIAGEWGQNVLDPTGPTSAYGDKGPRGTVEAFLCGPALERFYAEQSGHSRRLKDIVACAATDPHAQATLDRLTDRFAQAISVIINILDPHAIILGGGVGNIDALYTESTREKIAATIFNPTFEAALLKPSLGDSAGVFGAAMLVA